jgi:hypothetical protein
MNEPRCVECRPQIDSVGRRDVYTILSLAVSLDLPLQRFGAWAKRAARGSVFAGTLLGFASCGGGDGSSPVTTTPGASLSLVTTPAEIGPATKVVPVGANSGAVVALFPDGTAYYSPDGFNLGGGGSTTVAYKGALQVTDVVPVHGGVDALLSDGSVYFSPDGKNLGGGSPVVSAHAGSLSVASLIQVGTGVDAVFAGGGPVYYSPDGVNLMGDGHSVLIYAGGSPVVQIVPVGPGDAVVTLFADGAAYYSPLNRNLRGGGNGTVEAASARQITRLVKISGGVLAEVTAGGVHLSTDGKQLTAGASVAAWASPANAPLPARDSAHGAAFGGRLWVSGGFADPDNDNDCFSTCSYFDLWSTTDLTGAAWNARPDFATATTPNPRDTDPVVNGGVPDPPPPTDFYDAYAALEVWNGQLTAIGATVWRSADGVTWSRNNLADGVTAAPGPVPGRATENTRAAALGDALFVVQPDSGEVYRSSDANAAAWSDLGAIPGFAPRCGAAVFALQGKIWIEGGGACDYTQVYHDIWSSPDGVHWTQAASPAAWPARMWPCVTVSADGVAWLATGYWPTDWNNVVGITVRYGANHSDVWYSLDGSDWKQFKADVGSGLADDGKLEPRHAPTCFVTGDASSGMKLMIVAGSGGRDPNGFNARVLSSVRSLSVPAANLLP